MKIILISHSNFLGNSAMHVFSMAEQLQVLGHEVVMLVPDGMETVERHRKPVFPIRLYQDALDGKEIFENGGKPDLIHAWSPREHVRKVTLQLTSKYECPYVLHMEDNEEQIVTDELKNIDFEELKKYPKIYQDFLTKSYRSHPTHYREFAERAAGYTCLIDRLLEFKPSNVPGAMFWPGFDPEFENLPVDAGAARARYGISTDEIIVLYSGNVHHSIAADVRNLYLAVAILRARGQRIRLLRTGWNNAPIDVLSEPTVADCFIELGFVDRSEMPMLLAMADLLVQPGRSDPFNDFRFPSKLPEFLISGKPVILPDSNIGNALVDGHHVLKLHDGSLSELLERMEQLIIDRKLAESLGRESRAFAQDHLRWSQAAEIASRLYADIAAVSSSTVETGLNEAVISEGRPELARLPVETDAEAKAHPVKLVGFYLPQFHPIKENNEWWGQGFTEWTNVSRAKAQMFGHRQPRLPTELGYYDLRVVETMHEQARLAAEYGVGGFCFYVYWFEGRRLLERPVDIWKERGPDFPFCICWANENWSRRWDGSEADILMSQDYSPGFEERFIVDMIDVLKDPRYIRVDGAPVLAIYRVSEFPDPVASATAFRRAAEKHGIPRIHLTIIQSFGISDPRVYGFDAAVEFSPPHINRLLLDPQLIDGTYPEFSGYVEDYVGVATQSINAPPTDYVRYRGCFPMWDNTARRGKKGHVFVNDSPKAYGHWLRFLVHEAMLRRDQVEPIVFINAWNEWAEGTYLEPDEHYGRAFLEITQLALVHGVADYALGGTTPERERLFTAEVSRLPKLY